jgi:hypothetical protein
MRPQQQNRRMRGRNNNNNNNNNRKGPNPLTRNYESNGPDVKIRGSAQQIAEKYTALARDAQSSGDRVMAENYLQHAEHYNRIIAAAQAQMPIQNIRDPRDDLDEDGEDDLDGIGGLPSQPTAEPMPINNGSGPQPVIEGTPAEVALNQEGLAPAGNERREHNGTNGYVGNGEAGDDPQRRSRRPRRGRGRPEQGEGQPPAIGSQPDEQAAPATNDAGGEPEDGPSPEGSAFADVER